MALELFDCNTVLSTLYGNALLKSQIIERRQAIKGDYA